MKDSGTVGQEHTLLEEPHHYLTTLHQDMGLGPYPAIKGLSYLEEGFIDICCL